MIGAERKIKNEAETRDVFEEMARPYFWLWPEVQMRHYSGERLRIDYVGLPFTRFQTGLVGFELKGDGKGFQGFNRALKQGIDYRQSEIIDRRLSRFPWKRLLFVFIYHPRCWGRYSTLEETESIQGYQGWLAGAARLAGLYNVGVLNTRRWGPWDGWRLEISETPLWDSKKGLRGNGLLIGSGASRQPGNS